MKKQIYLHIGFGKRVISTIQKYLFLKRRNINTGYYPKKWLDGKGHNNLATLIKEVFLNSIDSNREK